MFATTMELFGFVVTGQDLLVVGFLVFLEGILSIDNALVLAMLAKPLPPHLQRRALTYGFVGAVVFRLISVLLAAQLMRWTWVKVLGGLYLVVLACKNLLTKSHSPENARKQKRQSFWKTVLLIELTDVAFAVDSILAAVALTPKLELVFIGGVLGILLMRFAASVFLKLLNVFPKFEKVAYLLVLLIGCKLLVESAHLPGVHFHSPKEPAFWVFWGLMAITVGFGFTSKDQAKTS